MKVNAVLKALSHPIRRDIVSRLRDGALTAGDLADAYDVSKPTMSTHFAALKEADLVTAERDGNSIYYHLNVTVAEEALSALMSVLGAGEEKKRRAHNRSRKEATI
ncbi:MAG: hypothetical protein DHS20C05_04180 [Hyphococcus sp.]|nr:MAG: hypothetical protein DHS20C05_04180 [Marinicaulis sp.]